MENDTPAQSDKKEIPPAVGNIDSKAFDEIPAEPVAASDLTKDLAQGMPEVTATEKVDDAAPIAYAVDKKGQKFDPTIHAANSDGSPKTNSHGNFYKKTIGRPGTKATFSDASLTVDNSAQIAEKLVEMTNAIGVMILSEEAIMTDSDKQIAIPLTQNWVKSRNMTDVDPRLGLLFGAAAIYLPKSQKPKVKDRLGAIGNWFKSLFGKK